MNVADVDQLLSTSYTPEGIVKWWYRKRTNLGGLTPNEAWAAGRQEDVYNLAKSLLDSNSC